MFVTLIISTFNRPHALSLILQSVRGQTVTPGLVCICDDGSGISTTEVVKSWQRDLSIKHIWLPNQGFRAARSRNLGILSGESYLIFIDGDCLLPPKFIENHIEMACRGRVVAGGRHLLSEDMTCEIIRAGMYDPLVFKSWKFRKIPLGLLRDVSPYKWAAVRTCNMGMFLEDARLVSGFDESFVGWGREDSDFVVRLLNRGLRIRSGRLAACVAHLYHDEADRDRLSDNETRFQYTLANSDHVLPQSSILLDL